MGLSNLPPGVRESDIPGNRPGEAELEKAVDEFAELMTHPGIVKVLNEMTTMQMAHELCDLRDRIQNIRAEEQYAYEMRLNEELLKRGEQHA